MQQKLPSTAHRYLRCCDEEKLQHNASIDLISIFTLVLTLSIFRTIQPVLLWTAAAVLSLQRLCCCCVVYLSSSEDDLQSKSNQMSSRLHSIKTIIPSRPLPNTEMRFIECCLVYCLSHIYSSDLTIWRFSSGWERFQ